MKALLLLSAVAATVATATVSAQVTTAKPDSGCTTDSDGRVECRIIRSGRPGDTVFRSRLPNFDRFGGQAWYRMDSAMAKRAALGLELRTTGTKRDTLGVFVEAVTPKGPAESAGIIEGDRIAAINGVDLRTQAGDTEDSYANGLAAHRLGREVQKLTPGARVNLRIFSGGRFRDVQVTAGKASDVMRLSNRFEFTMPGMDGMREFDGPDRMMFGPDSKMMLDRMAPLMKERLEPLTKERIEPLLRQLNELPRKIQIRTPVRARVVAPIRVQRTYRV
jgi:PDZ domain